MRGKETKLFSENQVQSPLEKGGEVRAFVYLMGEVFCVASFDKARIIIGRSPELDLVLNCTTVSRIHAMLSIENNSLVIEDLDSKNGVWVAGRAIRRTVIKSWEPVGIGSFVLRFHLSRKRVPVAARPLGALDEEDEYTLEDEAFVNELYSKPSKAGEGLFDGIGLKKEITKVTKAPQKRLTSGLHDVRVRKDDKFKND